MRVWVFGVLCLSIGCAGGGERFSRHFEGGPWSASLRDQWHDPWRRYPEVSLLATSLALIPFDEDIQDEIGHDTRNTGADASDVVSYVAIGAPIIWGGVSWVRGDEARKLEVSLESLGTTALTSSVLKEAINRHRPDRSADNSFPSAHTSITFAGATLLANFIDREADSKLGYLFYLPAAYVAVERVRDDKHWATDVAAGAFLGTFLTNLIFDAHYDGIFAPEPRARISMAPMVVDRGTGAVLRIDF